MADKNRECPDCGEMMEIGTVHGTPHLLWSKRGKAPGRLGTIARSDRLASVGWWRTAKLDAWRCPACRVFIADYSRHGAVRLPLPDRPDRPD